MSSADAERRRRESLEAMRAKARGGSKPSISPTNGSISASTKPYNAVPQSPDVLVPPSSSPVPAITPKHSVSKFFAANGTNGFSSSGAQSNGSVIPSSKLSSNVNGNAQPRPTAGTPQAVMASMLNRKTSENQPREANQQSLSYEGTSNGQSLTADSSPSSPQPLSRLKPKYDESPTQASTSISRPSISKAPSLVNAAKAVQQMTMARITPEEEKEVDRIVTKFGGQFPILRRDLIRSAVLRHPRDLDAALNEIHTIAQRHATSTPTTHVMSRPTPLSSSPVSFASSSKTTNFRPPTYLHTPNSIPSSKIATSSPLAATPKPAPKPRKGEKSRIYANRAGKGKRKDPDESESEAEAVEGEAQSEEESDEGSWSGDEGRQRKRFKGAEDELDAEGEALKAFNEVDEAMLTGTIACSAEQAAKIISLRPYENVDAVYTKLNKARGVSFKLFEQYTEIMEGYVQIDSCLNRCESIAADVANTLSVWRGASMINDSVVGTPRSDGMNDVKVDVAKVDELLKMETDMKRRKILSQYIQTQPPALSEGTILKDYQLLGVNWLNLLYSKKIGCILADEMGLGKTIQVIAFLAHLKERKIKGPHMIFVPASTLENWVREFEKFCPDIDVQSYYGTQAERADLRDTIKRQFRKGKLQVVLASYTQVAAADDLSFFRKKIQFETCIYDEGHRLKSCTTKAYSDLMSIKPRWRCLLTGTPLQNNLQELVSLLMFIHKDVFTDAEPYLRAIFKSQGHANLLSSQRVSRARKMLTPFVLRRRKAHVLDLPPKIETVEHCQMTPVQAKLYRQTLQRSKKVLQEMDETTLEAEANAADDTEAPKAKSRSKAAEKKSGSAASSSSHILMDLRKAASHPLLFRRLYSDAKVRSIAKACLGTPKWCDSNFDYVVEDLEIMSDAEIHHFCEESEYDSIKKFALSRDVFLEGGKVIALKKHIDRCKAEGKRMLLFSQFVMILDILQVALQHMDIKYTRLDGSTRTDERQLIVDEFTEDPDITVFLLSTKAGGVGINLTAASVVIIYDQDFNPHNDRQAADRAYRIGQDKDVEVIKLVSKDSIDEDMLAIGATKLKLDDAVGGEEVTLDSEAAGPGQKDDKTAKEVKKSLLTTLRNKFEAKTETDDKGNEELAPANGDEASLGEQNDVEMEEAETPRRRKARGGPATQVS
ncbi:SNF2 family N-terminal domain-domain-containing protein [Kockovaella imperatae]|uniref:SNF2 family N-terminal domain-domain-containing protein n=1 Tax=Kockovaella imperatae TaxID=4999 RepID=A0A1Y1UET5_9TREE|nr:SNF2 family N-terminal domain-domain-containing protein [Kockovaella imperatae]ORX36499.1 SNF2 family N-terminal domain-domain-containing protein [Kockovaella imperatae]